MKVIIAEKPSLARNIVNGIESFESYKLSRHNGYYEGGDYIVTWAFGHLFSLVDVEDYYDKPKSEKTKWTMDNLPCFPEKFKFKMKSQSDGNVDSGVEKQFNIISLLCNRNDVDSIVNAGDADREGEIIVRLCVTHALKTKKRLLRLWLPDQTPETIKKSLIDLKSEDEYNNLANEGFARTYIDWLYGVNLTRYATLKTGTLLRVGRVIIPIVKAIYDRDMAIRNFKSEVYYVISSHELTNGESIDLTSKKDFDKNDIGKANSLCDLYNSCKAIVTGLKKKKSTIQPGKLYSLTKLQNMLGKKYKMSMEDSLSIVQKLYESGYLTYPRTNSEYLATAEKDKVKSIISSVKKLGYPVEFKDGKNIFDDSKIESHSALTPTYKIPNPSKLSENEKIVYSAVMRRFVAVFCSEECLAEKTEITISIDDKENFILKGTVITQKGWMKFDTNAQKDKILPSLKKGDIVNINFKPEQKMTSAPKHYTIETLNNYLKNPFRDDKASANRDSDDDSEDYRAIFEGLELGTEATRTGIINNACKSNYIKLSKDVYTILPSGEFLIESLMRMQINMDKYKTSEMGKALKNVYHGNISVDESVDLAKKEINTIFQKKIYPPETDMDYGYYGDDVGKCPLCEGRIIRTKYGYGCNKYKDGCKFKINGCICDRIISVENVKMLLRDGRTSKIKGFISKRTGKSFDAYLVLKEGKIEFDFQDPAKDLN